MSADLWFLYADMLKCRLYEEAIARLWEDGLISGEMHLGTGEEAINVGVVSHLLPGDAMALDHRGTAAMLVRGVDPVLIIRELLGRADGLCGGHGGHMHLYSKAHLAASSGIVGAAGPAAAGFALASDYLRPGAVALSFFGEGAMNQGMLMESINLASVWRLPILFVCKDDEWSITTPSAPLSGGTLRSRVNGLGVPYLQVDGLDVKAVGELAHKAIEKIRSGKGPIFLHATCVHLDAHFLGYQLVRAIQKPWRELPRIVWPLMRSFLHPKGGSIRQRVAGMNIVIRSLLSTLRDPRRSRENDPVERCRLTLSSDPIRLKEIEDRMRGEVAKTVAAALQESVA